MSDDQRLASIERRLERVESTLQEVRDKVLSFRMCPQPGLCLDINHRVDDHETRLRICENVQSQSKGMSILARGIWGTIGASVLAGIIALIKHL